MWRPSTEAEACSEVAAFIEWLRATRGLDDLDPVSLGQWRLAEPGPYAAAKAAFQRLGAVGR